MKTELPNPFDLVKATDLSDRQIANYFVDFPEGASLVSRVKPRSPMPMIIFGGKGSGKTHLMRYLSYPLQVSRHGGGVTGRTGVIKEGYVGIYFRCGGLNAQRFVGKGQPAEAWQTVFAYYMELWLGQLVLRTIRDFFADSTERLDTPDLVHSAAQLLDIPPSPLPNTLAGLLSHLEHLQREADIAINNSGLTRTLELRIYASPGRLVFGLPGLLVKHIPELKEVLFLYLVDEFENLTESQQQYINTLLRERQAPATLKIGVRLYGLRTKRTLSADEENRENSEYDVLRLDSELRDRPDDAQLEFASNLVRKRLVETGYLEETDTFTPEQYFDSADPDLLLARDTRTLIERYGERDRPYFASLRQKLEQGLRAEATPELKNVDDIDKVIQTLALPGHPFVERTSIFLFYRAWARRKPLKQAARSIAASANRLIKNEGGTEHQSVLKHFKADLIAQLLRETRLKQRYAGFDTFVKMSAGLPRGLLTILKHVYTWSLFYGEQPFRGTPISLGAQADGVSQASEWFFTEARAPGSIGTMVRDAMTRLGQLLRDIRFSDKPSESSICAFSADVTNASELARQVLEACNDWSMLIRIAGGQHDRNQGRVDDKYQVHPMLAPRWDLPIARRGALALAGEEINAIFAPSKMDEFSVVRQRRVEAMTAPLFGTPAEDEKKTHALFPPSDG